MDKRARFVRYSAWGALAAVVGVLSVETGAFVYLRHPASLIAIATAVGYAIFSRGRKAVPETATTSGLPIVNQILRLAKQHKGRITAAEVLAETSLELEDVKKALDELAYAGTCQLIVGEKGTQVYYFAEFEDATSKSTDVLDTSMVDATGPSVAQKAAQQKKDKL